jgi:plastocyanin
MIKMKLKILMLGMVIGFLAGCKKEDVGQNEVLINNSKFSPTTLTVSVGTTVTWTNKESMTHTVTSDNNIFSSGNMGKGDTFTYTFSTVGTFPYHCIFHSGMTGTVVVQ